VIDDCAETLLRVVQSTAISGAARSLAGSQSARGCARRAPGRTRRATDEAIHPNRWRAHQFRRRDGEWERCGARYSRIEPRPPDSGARRRRRRRGVDQRLRHQGEQCALPALERRQIDAPPGCLLLEEMVLRHAALEQLDEHPAFDRRRFFAVKSRLRGRVPRPLACR